MRRQRRALFLVAMFACPMALLLLYLAQGSLLFPPSPPLNRVAVWMPSSWDGARARASWETNRAHIQELSPVWYQLGAGGDGSINPYSGARDGTLVQQAHAQGTLVIPLINNYYDGVGVDAAPVGAVIHDPARRAAHVAVLVDEVLTHGYDGVDIDYESLNGVDDRDDFSLFIEELAAALHARGKLLAVTVHPKTYEPGSWSGPRAQDWKRIGAAADRFRVMTYAYSGCSSGPGPIAPLWWMEDVVRFATSTVPSNRVYAGIHFYGHDWGAGTCTSVTWETAQQRFDAHGTVRHWQGKSGWRREVAEPWFAYNDVAGQRHTVWYADGGSVRQRLDLVEKYGLGGIALWRLGGEDPAAWEAIAAALRAGEE
jgi:spore germination protein YaaH